MANAGSRPSALSMTGSALPSERKRLASACSKRSSESGSSVDVISPAESGSVAMAAGKP